MKTVLNKNYEIKKRSKTKLSASYKILNVYIIQDKGLKNLSTAEHH